MGKSQLIQWAVAIISLVFHSDNKSGVPGRDESKMKIGSGLLWESLRLGITTIYCSYFKQISWTVLLNSWQFWLRLFSFGILFFFSFFVLLSPNWPGILPSRTPETWNSFDSLPGDLKAWTSLKPAWWGASSIFPLPQWKLHKLRHQELSPKLNLASGQTLGERPPEGCQAVLVLIVNFSNHTVKERHVQGPMAELGC